MKPSRLSSIAAALLLSAAWTSSPAPARGTIDNGPFPDDLNGSNFTYPWPVKVFRFTSQLQRLEMALMDVEPACEPNGRTALLLHGKNFCGATWKATIGVLARRGYRVVAPDQVGFCKSSKPEGYQFSLSQLAWNTRGLLDALGVAHVSVVGHSLGGMLAVRFGLAYPGTVDELVLVDPVGLEDYMQKGVPYISIDEGRVDVPQHPRLRAGRILRRPVERGVRHVGADARQHLPRLAARRLRQEPGAGRRRGPDIARLALLWRPEAAHPALRRDRAAIGSQWAPPEVARSLGHLDMLGPEVARRIPRCTLHRFGDLGHAPQISDPERFHEILLAWLTAA